MEAPTLNKVAISSLHYGHEHPSKTLNARATDRDKNLDQLVASITSEGLLQALLVWVDPDTAEQYVIDGNRRLLALWSLNKQTTAVPYGATEVPVMHITAATMAEALSMSLAANIMQVPLHPVDQFEAFHELTARGLTVDQIAGRFAIEPKLVRQRIRLGDLAPGIREAWRAGVLTYETARAFALVTDHEAQESAFNRLKKAGRLWAEEIRAALVGNQAQAGSLLKFVGKENYERAGGGVLDDLFGDNPAVSDYEKLAAMADEKLRAKIDELIAQGWAFAKRTADMPRDWHWAASRQHLKKKDATAEQRAESGCVLSVENGSLQIEYGVILAKPAKPKVEKAHEDPDAPTTPRVSRALERILGETANRAIAEAFADNDAHVALAALLAGIAGRGDGPIKARVEGVQARGGDR